LRRADRQRGQRAGGGRQQPEHERGPAHRAARPLDPDPQRRRIVQRRRADPDAAGEVAAGRARPRVRVGRLARPRLGLLQRAHDLGQECVGLRRTWLLRPRGV
jgi:hypothetical protein